MIIKHGAPNGKIELWTDRAMRKHCARLIQKVYHVAPLCPKCQGIMKIISFSEVPDVTGIF